MTLADYLAKNYLTADARAEPKTKKKRKRKPDVGISGLVIADDDDSAWPAAPAGKDEDDDEPMNVSGQSADFRRTKKNNWTTVGAPTPSSAEQAAADAILQSAAEEQAARQAAGDPDERPTVIDGADAAAGSGPATTMESGARAGLQTGAQVRAAMDERAAEERSQLQALMKRAGAGAGAGSEGGEAAAVADLSGDTIYRDASGRIINVAMKRAEARKKADEADRRKDADLLALKGDVQLAQKEQRRRDLDDAKALPVARFADDRDLNDELKERPRWQDPAAGFLTKAAPAQKSVSGRPLYTGAAPPNRYAIRPGHRWDGVDRSNGFEKDYFKAKNRRRDLANLQYAWQTDE